MHIGYASTMYIYSCMCVYVYWEPNNSENFTITIIKIEFMIMNIITIVDVLNISNLLLKLNLDFSSTLNYYSLNISFLLIHLHQIHAKLLFRWSGSLLL